jgi:RNA polymerase sigma-70 factor, ECF subfamily
MVGSAIIMDAPCGASFAAGEEGEALAGGENRHATDLALARRAASGDMESFEEIYRRHVGRVYGLCLRMTGNAAEAEDMAQDVFVHIFRKIGTFRGNSALSTWLHRITVNQVLMHFRRRRSRPESVTTDGEEPVVAEPGTAGQGRLQVIDSIAIDQALAQLPSGYRTVFMLHDVEGYEHSEIGRMLGIATGTSKSQLHKARMKLKRLLRRTLPPGPR